MDKQKILERLMCKKIILFGCAYRGHRFFSAYKGFLDFQMYFSNNIKEKEFYDGENKIGEIVQPFPIEKKEDYFIVIASSAKYEMEEQLDEYGYKMGEHYISEEIATAILEDKLIAVFFGICQVRAISETMGQIKDFANLYQSFYFANYLPSSACEKQELLLLLKWCDLCVSTYFVTREEQYKYLFLKNNIPEKTRFIEVPVITFNGYFPRKGKSINRMNQYAVQAQNYPYTPFSYGDEWINELIEKDYDAERIINCIQKIDFFDESYIRKNAEDQFRYMRFLEQGTEYRISEYIYEFYRDKRLFRNEGHMENIVIKFMADQTGKIIGIQKTKENIISETEPRMHCSQHIIYPAIVHALDLKFDTENYELYTYKGWRKVTFSEYVKLYVEYARSVKKQMELGLFPENIT